MNVRQLWTVHWEYLAPAAGLTHQSTFHHVMRPSTPGLQSLVSSYEEGGSGSSFALGRHPAFVHCDATTQLEEWGYETRAAPAPWSTRVALATARHGRMGDAQMLAQAGAVYPIVKRPGGPFPDRIGIGRARSADVSLRFSSISKYHAYLTWSPDRSQWTLWDARSRNGTRVSKKNCGGNDGEGLLLDDGVDVYIGEEAFLFFSAEGLRRLIGNLAQRKITR